VLHLAQSIRCDSRVAGRAKRLPGHPVRFPSRIVASSPHRRGERFLVANRLLAARPRLRATSSGGRGLKVLGRPVLVDGSGFSGLPDSSNHHIMRRGQYTSGLPVDARGAEPSKMPWSYDPHIHVRFYPDERMNKPRRMCREFAGRQQVHTQTTGGSPALPPRGSSRKFEAASSPSSVTATGTRRR
jgi:hypothetical protein